TQNSTLSLHDALPISHDSRREHADDNAHSNPTAPANKCRPHERSKHHGLLKTKRTDTLAQSTAPELYESGHHLMSKKHTLTRERSEEHTSELQSRFDL